MSAWRMIRLIRIVYMLSGYSILWQSELMRAARTNRLNVLFFISFIRIKGIGVIKVKFARIIKVQLIRSSSRFIKVAF